MRRTSIPARWMIAVSSIAPGLVDEDVDSGPVLEQQVDEALEERGTGPAAAAEAVQFVDQDGSRSTAGVRAASSSASLEAKW